MLSVQYPEIPRGRGDYEPHLCRKNAANPGSNAGNQILWGVVSARRCAISLYRSRIRISLPVPLWVPTPQIAQFRRDLGVRTAGNENVEGCQHNVIKVSAGFF